MNTLVADSIRPVVDISVIIVNYNVRDFLESCLESVLRSQHQLSIEVIVVDNCSHDRSVEYLRPRFPTVRFESLSQNLGFGRANNIGLELCAGKYVLFLNPDTIIREDTLQIMFDYMEQEPGTGISGCKVLNPDGSFQSQCRRGFPTPWASFCKLFGLQTLFPRSTLFARYNQSFRNENETYAIDAVIGAFMFCRRSAVVELGGFDTQFFMYGEDLDLCYRMKQLGYRTDYVPLTTIIHFKGESTRRSSINESKHFYQAMETFARKHYASSHLFFNFLRIGIHLRSALAYVLRHRRSFVVMICDLASVLIMFMIAVKLRRGDYLALPAYAFPTVFVVLPLVVFTSMMLVGEYFEYKPSIRRSSVGLLFSFFILSSLTYYWNEYAFSRGVLLMTIGFSFVAFVTIRALVALRDKLFGVESIRRILLVGSLELTQRVALRMQRENALGVVIVGIVSDDDRSTEHSTPPHLGRREYLLKVIDHFNVDEVIILGKEYDNSTMITALQDASQLGVRFHVALDADAVVALGIAEGISSAAFSSPLYRILSLRARVFKRTFDLLCAAAALLILTPLVILPRTSVRELYSRWWKVFRGAMSVVGLYGPATSLVGAAKIGVTGLAHISKPETLSEQTVSDLNHYYVRNYSPSLDIDILIKRIFSQR